MTKKHFEAIARILLDRKDSVNSTIDFDKGFEHARERVANDLADYFETENPRFDRECFLAACGME